ncbi:MAG: PRD domain-containing protein [Lactobacillales bacterium]|nr:PRD domain-containing protein [Lactobacillales bacterium]
MKIKKILNNNVVVTEDSQNNEMIAMGRGIAFNRRIGDEVQEGQIEKYYRLASSELSLRFQELLEEIPLAVVEQSTDFVAHARKCLDKQISDTVYISIMDHLYTAIERAKNDVFVKNLLLWDIKRLFPEEFKLGIEEIHLVNEKFNVSLPEDEAGFLALHLVNAEMSDTIDDMGELTKIIQEIITIVKYSFQVSLNEDSVYFQRFATHLKFFAMRLLKGQISNMEEETDDELYLMVCRKYKDVFKVVQRICQFLVENYDYLMNQDEQIYLTIHIARIIAKTQG